MKKIVFISGWIRPLVGGLKFIHFFTEIMINYKLEFSKLFSSYFDAFPIHYFKTLTLCRDFKLFGISVITFLSKFIVNLLLLFRIKYPSIRNISHKSPHQQDLERECFIKDFSRNLTFKVWSECGDWEHAMLIEIMWRGGTDSPLGLQHKLSSQLVLLGLKLGARQTDSLRLLQSALLLPDGKGRVHLIITCLSVIICFLKDSPPTQTLYSLSSI